MRINRNTVRFSYSYYRQKGVDDMTKKQWVKPQAERTGSVSDALVGSDPSIT